MNFLPREFPGDDDYEPSDCGNIRGLPWFLAILFFCLSGCALAPDKLFLSANHVSQPGRGYGPYPIGGPEGFETTYESINAGARWEHRNWFAEASCGYVIHATNWVGSDAVCDFRGGVQWRLQ